MIEMKKVMLKTSEAIVKLIKNREVLPMHTSDSGEWTSYGVGENPTVVKTFWYDDHGKEFLVVDHPNPISKDEYDRLKILFNEKE